MSEPAAPGMGYLQAGASTDTGGPQATPLGNNPSTAAGFIVIGALVVLAIARKSFSRYL